MRLSGILPAFALGMFVSNVHAHQCFSYRGHIDFVGHDIGNHPGKPEDCCDLCYASEECAAFSSSDYNGGTCWLKSTPDLYVYNDSIIAGAKSFRLYGLCMAEYNTDYVGNDIGNKPANNVAECCEMCRQDIYPYVRPRCLAYTWSDYNGGTC